jgi:hypothetical protein
LGFGYFGDVFVLVLEEFLGELDVFEGVLDVFVT